MKIKENETYADFIRKIRLSKKLTTREFAKEVGVSPTVISLWENGKCEPSLKSQRKIDGFASQL